MANAKRASFVLLFGLAGWGCSDQGKSTQQVLEVVHFGTPLAQARQAMEERQFSCSLLSYTNPAQAGNKAEWDLWRSRVIKGGHSFPVTNVSVLKCTKTGCVVTFTVVNGETCGLAVKGRF